MTEDELIRHAERLGMELAVLGTEAERMGFVGYVSVFTMTPGFLDGDDDIEDGTHAVNVTLKRSDGRFVGIYSKDGGCTWEVEER